jgi:hypothetical protein
VTTTTCESCGAEIICAKIDGKTLPLNKRRVRVYRMEEDGSFELEKTVDPRQGNSMASVVPCLRYISHFITCPNASLRSKKER